jgi:clan AA aspartic protease
MRSVAGGLFEVDFMETATVGKVVVPARVENIHDLFEVQEGRRTPEQVRWLEIPDALVDTGASALCMPGRFIQQLGLRPFRSRTIQTASGTVTVKEYGTVRLTIQGRECTTDVVELPEHCPVLIGQLPLEMLDWVVDTKGQKLIGNPAHGGEPMYEMWSFVDRPCSP